MGWGRSNPAWPALEACEGMLSKTRWERQLDQEPQQQRDPEMHQTKKGKQWYFGMKAHVGVDS